ncbi:MAG: ABC transporter ATP-binding protein, partial [Verrucomicrobiota bacterium]
THLDMASIDALTMALKEFQGTLIFISHDVYFIRSIAETVLHIDQGTLTRYHGGYDYYLEKSGIDSERAALTAGQPGQTQKQETKAKTGGAGGGRKTKEQKRKEAEERQRRAKERKKAQEKLTQVETRVATLEARQTEIAEKLDDPSLYQTDPNAVVSLNRELGKLMEELDQANAQWEELAEAVEAV